MCLTVREVPADRNTFLINTGWKLLKIACDGVVTPYQYGYVCPRKAKSAWLFPNVLGDAMAYRGRELHDGYIHYFTNETRAIGRCWTDGRFVARCYCFGSVAFSECTDESACLGMYIAMSKRPTKTERIIQSYMDGEVARNRLSVNSLVRDLPELSAIKKQLLSWKD